MSRRLDEQEEFLAREAQRSCGCKAGQHCSHQGPQGASGEALMDHLVQESVARAVFGNGLKRREFFRAVGGGAAMAALASVFPMGCAQNAVKEETASAKGGAGIEKKDLKVAFIPISCAAPIIMADPLGFYKKNGLNVELLKGSGWAVVRDQTINGEVDAAHMLMPMPLAISMGLGSQKKDFVVPISTNVNGNAITLHVKHKGLTDPKQMKGFRLGIPFDFSMHNLLLRYYLAEAGLDPNKDVELRTVAPPQMLANLKSENIDGFIAPDTLCQRAVFEKTGFIHKLTKDIWDGHPCCAFTVSKDFATQNPNTFKALFTSLVQSTEYAHQAKNRVEIAKAIAPANYLNQPLEVVESVLTGRFDNGAGDVRNVPDRLDFDPFPYESMAIWILTQMKRWGYIKGDVDYQKIASQVFQADECRDVMKANGFQPPAQNATKVTFAIGKTKVFDPAQPEKYLESFAIKA